MKHDLHPLELFVGGIVLVAGPIYSMTALMQELGLEETALAAASIAFGIAWMAWLGRLSRMMENR